jgi:hypothetical protein
MEAFQARVAPMIQREERGRTSLRRAKKKQIVRSEIAIGFS